MNNKKLLGLRIKELRKSKKFTQESLSELIGAEVGTLSAIESGRNFPSIYILEKISNALEYELGDFFKFKHLEVNIIDVDEAICNIVKKQNSQNKKFILNLLKGGFETDF